MKTPIDSSAAGAGATTTLLDGGAPFVMVDLWKITLNGGGVVRWHGADLKTPLSFTAAGGQPTSANGTYLPGPLIDRGKISTKLGLEVATVDVKFQAVATDLINGTPLDAFTMGRGFDGATVVLYRAFLPTFGSAITGVVIAFSGRVTQIKDISRTGLTMTLSAWTVLLNVNMGPDVFQAGCLNTHYDADCTLTATNVAGAVNAFPTVNGFGSTLTNPDGYFDKGTLTFTSGVNAGISRTVQAYNGSLFPGGFGFAFGWPAAPGVGDTFNAVRGCLLTMADCTAQSNLIHFRGQPFTPPAITGALG